MSETTSREIRLASRPRGWPTEENFELVTVEVPPPGEGEALVRNLFMSVDPYMRGRMNDVKSYVPPFQVGKPLEGGAVGEVVASRAAGFSPGDVVTSMRGWRELFIAPARELQRADPRVRPLSAHLGVLGATGFTAWIGLELAKIEAGNRVFVSGAAGAVGSIAGQLAKLGGCRIVGSAGGPEKVKMLIEELGFDAAFDYKQGDLEAQLKAAAPDGIDVYFDNVGGPQLEAALAVMRLRGRIIACGAISQYNDEVPPPGPRNLALVIGKRLSMQGFLLFDWNHRQPAFLTEVGALYAAGKLRAKETVVRGLENAPRAFLNLLRGVNVGKMVVQLD
jgi:NADPH-dependent curcumin reductase CurA